MAKHKKECAFSTTEDHFSWRVMGLKIYAGAPVTGTYRVHPVGCEKYKSLTIKQFQRLVVLWQQHPMWYLLDCCTWDPCSGGSGPKGFPRGVTPFAWSRSHGMLMCLGNVEETLVPVPASRVGRFMSSQDAKDRCLSQGCEGTLKSGSVEGPSSLMAHQPSGDVGCISCT